MDLTPILVRIRASAAAAVLLALVSASVGCTPKVGDSCDTAVDCSTLGDRLCDTNQPGGYCTIFNCEPDGCPDEAACVAFDIELDPACGPLDDAHAPRFGRTFCMRVCEADDDCRSGYKCLKPTEQDALMLDLEQENATNTRVCLVETIPISAPSTPPGICEPGDGGGGLTPYQPTSTTGAGGSGGATSTTGAGGSGGAGGS
ncbi:MAG: hypothetical protein VB934_17775, partial [Polyangiaceae bacterium]